MNDAQRAAILRREAKYRSEHPEEAARLDALFAPVRAEMDRLRLQMARVEFVVALEELLARRAGESPT